MQGSTIEMVQQVSFLFVSISNSHITQNRFSCSLIHFIIIYIPLTIGWHIQCVIKYYPQPLLHSVLSACLRHSRGLQHESTVRAKHVEVSHSPISYNLAHLYSTVFTSQKSTGCSQKAINTPSWCYMKKMYMLSVMAHSETRLLCLL